jgi:high affinity sulfate transporter 1
MGTAHRSFGRLLPLSSQLGAYRREWLSSDVLAGLSVAAVSLPVAIAYPAIAGLPIEVGIYSAIISAAAYALFGPSPKLVIGPDTATTIMLGSALLQLGMTDIDERVTTAAALALLTGVLCLLAGFARLGFVANFLSRPVLVGFLAGVALSLMIGQIGRLTGVRIEADGLIRPLIELATKLRDVHLSTLVVSVALFMLLRLLRWVRPRYPGPLIAILVGMALTYGANLPEHGVAVVGAVDVSAPTFGVRWPSALAFNDLVLAAMGILLVSFGSGIVTARSFGAKNHYDVDGNRELIGFGAANAASGLFGGFPVSGADSRTAVNDAVGGKTQLATLVCSAALAIAFFFIGDTLAYLPAAALGAVLASAAVDLIDSGAFLRLWRVSRIELLLAVVTAIGVVVFGVLQSVILAVGATLAHLLWLASQPRDALLGRIPGRDGLYKLHAHPEAEEMSGLVIYLLQGSLVFFNADYVKMRILAIVDRRSSGPAWFILDASAISHLDASALDTLDEVRVALAERGVIFGIADMHSRPRAAIGRSGLEARIGSDMVFGSAEAAIAAFERRAMVAGTKPRAELTFAK